MLSYIREFISGDIGFVELGVILFSMLFVIFCAAPLHEFAHALAAVKLGDNTPRLQGRLTINPVVHIDPIGALMILVCGFGYAKPVSVYMHNFKKPKVGMAIVALAGPLSNLIQAFIALVICNLVSMLGFIDSTILGYIILFFSFAAQINIGLAVFNLLPIPPLDGSRIATAVIPDKYYYKVMQYERYIQIALFALLFTNILSTPLNYLSDLVFFGLNFVASLPFRLIFG